MKDENYTIHIVPITIQHVIEYCKYYHLYRAYCHRDPILHKETQF